MKKIVIILLCLLCTRQTITASEYADFQIDESQCKAQLEAISALEATIATRGDVSYATLQAENSHLLGQAAVAATLETSIVRRDRMPIAPSFVWGLCLGVAGLAAVYFVTQKNRDIVWAAVGCTMSTVIFGLGWLGIFG